MGGGGFYKTQRAEVHGLHTLGQHVKVLCRNVEETPLPFELTLWQEPGAWRAMESRSGGSGAGGAVGKPLSVPCHCLRMMSLRLDWSVLSNL